MTTRDSLSLDDLALWHAFKRAGETVRRRVGEEITQATGLSDPDYGILTRLDDASGELRQQELATSLGWHRSRLSHQLTRMETRGLLERSGRSGGAVLVILTDAGRAAADRARPVHAAAVRRHLLAPLAPAERDGLVAALARLEQG